MIDEILEFNKKFVDNEEYKPYISTKYPTKKVAILSCMDTRLTHLLPAALGVKNGDVKIIKNAGGTISSPFGSVMKSLIVAIYELGVDEVLVIGHYDCGMQNIDVEALIDKMENRHISEESLKLLDYCGVNFKEWLSGFDDVEESVLNTTNQIIEHPLIPKDVKVHGLVMDPTTGALKLLK
ncbi:MAG: carbonic anhydrase [Erysipelotrichaceae bacterium]